MKDNICIFILAVILLILVGRLLHLKQEGTLTNIELETLHKEQKYALDTEEAANVRSAANTVSSAQNKGNNLADSDELPEYSLLYPDLYVDTGLGSLSYREMLKADLKTRGNFAANKAVSEKKVAYLTFDDGPSNTTKQILKILDEKEVKATFFVIGNLITEKNEELIQLILDKGHRIGIHTNSHNFTEIYCSVEKYLEDFYLAYERIYEVTGQKVSIFRFPGGSKNSFCRGLEKKLIPEMERRGFNYYDWNVTADDSIGRPSEYTIYRNVMKNLKRYQEPVILLHDSSINKLTASALPSIIDDIKKQGYEFGLVEDRKPCHFN